MPVSNNDEDDLQYNVDVNKVVSDIFGANKDRNNLAVQIENGTEFKYFVKYEVVHGVTSTTKGDPTLTPADKRASSYTVGLEAKGEGSNIVFLLECVSKEIMPVSFMAATPSNKQNYIRFNGKAKKSMDDIKAEVSECDKRYAENGPTYTNLKTKDSQHKYYAEMSITGASPAVCMFRIRKGKAPT